MESAAPPSPASPPVQRGGPVRPQVPVTGGSPVRRQRRWVLVAVGILAAVVGVLAAVAAVNQAGDREQVLVLARDVPLGQELSDDDLKVAAVSADPAITPVDASERAEVVGRTATVSLVAGSLLTEAQLGESGPADGQQVVGVEAARRQLPAGLLVPGDAVLVVSTPAEGEEPAADEPPATIDATVVSVSRADQSGTVVVNLAVADGDGPVVAARAATGQVALVREPKE
ncbi:SAF domain-containing protein [Streptomyces aculeolatus]